MKKPPPLLGYNTNVRHAGMLFHIQTEDSGIDHPHIITHLFVEGTILATKKTAYDHVLADADWERQVRTMMKDQHRSMFVELRDGAHDGATSRLNKTARPVPADPAPAPSSAEPSVPPPSGTKGVRVIRPAMMSPRVAEPNPKAKSQATSSFSRGHSIFDITTETSDFGENLITDKSLDEVILSYLTDELEE